MTAIFASGREAFLNGAINYSADNIRVCLIDQAIDNPNPLTDDFFADITAGAITGNGGANTRAACPLLAGKSSTNGTADANDSTITLVPAGPALASILIFRDSGADGTSQLIAKIDTGTGLPVTPNGGDVTIAWAGVGGIFTL